MCPHPSRRGRGLRGRRSRSARETGSTRASRSDRRRSSADMPAMEVVALVGSALDDPPAPSTWSDCPSRTPEFGALLRSSRMKKKAASRPLSSGCTKKQRALVAVRSCASAVLLASVACDARGSRASLGALGEPILCEASSSAPALIRDVPADSPVDAPSSVPSAPASRPSARRFIAPQPPPRLPGVPGCDRADPLCPM